MTEPDIRHEICNSTEKKERWTYKHAKYHLYRNSLTVRAKKVVIRLEKVLKKERAKFAEPGFSPMTVDELNKRIDKSLFDANNGRITENSDIAKEIKEWN